MGDLAARLGQVHRDVPASGRREAAKEEGEEAGFKWGQLPPERQTMNGNRHKVWAGKKSGAGRGGGGGGPASSPGWRFSWNLGKILFLLQESNVDFMGNKGIPPCKLTEKVIWLHSYQKWQSPLTAHPISPP